MKFWDSSAVVPLVVGEPRQKRLLSLLESDREMVVWWATPVEVCSAIARREREGALPSSRVSEALVALEALSASWREVQPAHLIRITAQRLLRVHPLRAADALQLASAIQLFGPDYASGEFVSLDERLNEAASREGLRVLK